MTHLLEQIKAHSTRLFEKTQQTRRHLHAHPELSFEEFETARFVAERLRNLGLSPQEGIAGTGVVVTIEGTKAPSSRVIGLRADMDALPILEQNEVHAIIFQDYDKGLITPYLISEISKSAKAKNA